MLESITYLISRCVDKIKGQLNNMVKRKHILSFKGILYMLQKYFGYWQWMDYFVFTLS